MTPRAGWYNHVHPAFRIICFVIFSFFLALGNPLHIGFAVFSVVVIYLLTGRQLLPGLWKMLRRMRWFLLSIFIIYAWFEPDAASEINAWLPSQAGLIEGGQRVLALVCIVAAVHWLLFVTPRQQLVSALYWLSAPLQFIGLPRQRIAVRLALILDYVVDVQAMVSQQLKQENVSKININAYANFASGLVEMVVEKAEQSVCEQIEIDVADVPSIHQWAWPILLFLIMMMLS